ncbi:hypothetical protein COO60DRAFT_1518567 [Scenedesmus sp. NREL 46B-D3]|nr:hypothetical protein COO60DRAFT_1518567 [Scenedesmus sp. NREL 46B-D3]
MLQAPVCTRSLHRLHKLPQLMLAAWWSAAVNSSVCWQGVSGNLACWGWFGLLGISLVSSATLQCPAVRRSSH